MNNEELHIDENLEDQEYLRQQVIETCDKLKEDLGLTWKSIGLLAGKKSGGNFQNVYYGHQTASGDHVKDLKLLLKLLLKIQQFYKGGDNPFNFLINEDPAIYAPIKQKLESIEEKIDYSNAIADRAIEREANGNEELGEEIRKSIRRNAEKKRQQEEEKLANAKKVSKKKKTPAKSTGNLQKEDTPPPSIEGNNAPA